MRFYTSDQHVGHKNILILGEGRPFRSLSHMHTEMMKRHNSVVGKQDEVIFLGDIAMGSFEESIKFFEKLNGIKFLIPGNHEKIFTGTNTHKRIENFTPLYEEAGFTILPENTSTMIDNQEVLLSHFPYQGDHVGVERFVKNRPVDTGLPLIHGHTHYTTQFSENPRMFHAGVDANNFTPVAETEIIGWLNRLRNQKLI